MKIKETHILDILKNEKDGVSINTILKKLNLSNKYKKNLKRILKGMVKKGFLYKKNNKFFLKNTRLKYLTGKVELKDNFGFVLAEDGKDVFIGKKSIKNLLPGDTVEVLITREKKGRREGVLKQIIKRTESPVMCKIIKINNIYYGKLVFKDTPLIKIQEGNFSLNEGDIVLVNIIPDDNNLNLVRGEVISHLADKNNINMYKEFILDKNEIKRDFPYEVKEEVKKIIKQDFTSAKKKRKDFTGKTIITIDPVDAKDFDDAVSLEVKDDKYILGVHIADVSFYVNEYTSLDKEAYERGFSVYLPDSVIPMLPEELSNNLCSLRENEEKFTLSIIMEIDKKGEILKYDIVESIIKSKRRFTYEEVEKILKNKKKLKDANIKNMLFAMEKLKNILGKNLKEKGMLDFELGDPLLVFNSEKEIIDIIRKKQLTSHKIIEYFMIYANICAADFILKHSKYGMFRIHPKPVLKDIMEFNNLMKALGLKIKIKTDKNKDFQKVLNKIKDSGKKFLIEKKLLRTLRLAKYSEKQTEHFGLGLKKYAHFTSPIRRYPDIIVHRLIKHFLNIKKMKNFSKKYLKEVALHISNREEKVESAEFDVFKLYSLYFLKQMVGEEFKGIITKITKNGLFIELLDYPIEGFLNFDTMNDYYIYDPSRQIAIGRRTKRVFKLGDMIDIILIRVGLEDKKIVLELNE